MSNKFEVYEDTLGKWRWRLRAANGEIVAQSEGYASYQNARRGAETARVVASDSEIEEATMTPLASVPEPDDV